MLDWIGYYWSLYSKQIVAVFVAIIIICVYFFFIKSNDNNIPAPKLKSQTTTVINTVCKSSKTTGGSMKVVKNGFVVTCPNGKVIKLKELPITKPPVGVSVEVGKLPPVSVKTGSTN